jgi:tetratricopeptide (TPR) repeat protein
VNAWQALAVCQMAQGQAAQAMATVDQAHAALPNDPSLAALKSHSQLLIDAGQDDNLHAVAMSVLANPLNSDVALQLIKIVQDNHRANTMESLASALTQLIQKNPDNQPAQLQLVQCYLDMGRYQAAQAAAQRAMAVFPNDPKPAQAAMLVCQTLGDWTNMESAAQNWKARAPQAAEGADGGAANAETHMHNYQAALSRLQPYLPAMKSDPGRHADLLATYATASVGAGDVATASDLLWPFAQSSQLGRQDWMRLAANQLDAATASDWLNRVATVIPADSIIEQSELAEAYDKLGRRMNDPALISNAADRFTQLAADPKADAMVILAAGGEMERSGKLPEAEALYRKTIALDPNSWVARNNLAMVIINRGGDLKEAVQLAQSAVAAQPHKADVYDTLGEAQSKSGDPKSAADSMRVAILLEPDSLQWRVSLARYLLNANNLIEATQALNEIDAHFPDVRAQSADLQQELADIRKLVQNKGT